jgi:hypothetical protein
MGLVRLVVCMAGRMVPIRADMIGNFPFSTVRCRRKAVATLTLLACQLLVQAIVFIARIKWPRLVINQVECPDTVTPCGFHCFRYSTIKNFEKSVLNSKSGFPPLQSPAVSWTINDRDRDDAAGP